MGSQYLYTTMIVPLQFLVISGYLALSLSEYVDHTSYYPDYGYVYNNTIPTYNKRIFTDDYSIGGSASISLYMYIPVPDLGTSLSLSTSFRSRIPVISKSDSGRSFSSSSDPDPRFAIYKYIERYIKKVTGADGHSCLLRSMCEASSTPLHNEGFIGDAINFLLTSNYAADQSDENYQTYLRAQAKGRLTGDCCDFHQMCPISFFKFVGDSLF